MLVSVPHHSLLFVEEGGYAEKGLSWFGSFN